ncbi:MAG: tetratricopeptide repeat protein, partial [Bacteroidales bacterium]|nr:tetratricopeptide repeat protein [Bacteroidales bacterium]
MDREQLYNYMKQPEALDSSSIEELQRAVETYPYFQTGRLLYTKGLHLTGDPKYGDELGKAALFCADRS